MDRAKSTMAGLGGVMGSLERDITGKTADAFAT